MMASLFILNDDFYYARKMAVATSNHHTPETFLDLCVFSFHNISRRAYTGL